MANNFRSKQDIYCVSGDDFFNNKSLHHRGLRNAHYISDHWHLFNLSLPKLFGEYCFKIIERELHKMSKANDENEFNTHFESAKYKLESLPNRKYSRKQVRRL